MSSVTMRIFQSVKGDPSAIQSLAAAIAKSDSSRVGEILAAKGLVLEQAEIESVMSTASQYAGASNTNTNTNTNT